MSTGRNSERKTMMISTCRYILVALVLVVHMALGSQLAVGQDHDAATIDMEIIRKKVFADKKYFVAQHMGLTESEAAAFWPVYDRYQQELATLSDRSRALIREYAEYFKTMSDDVAKKLINELLSIQSDRVKLRQNYLPQFRKVVSEIMVVRYYQIENKIQAVLDYALAANIPLIR
jgi:DNA-directed RNA polymerase subunit F